jgi:hypothetical protein
LRSSVHDIRHEELRFRSYKIQTVYQLLEEDYEMSVSQESIEWIDSDEYFLSKLSFNDEAVFHLSGKVNHCSNKIWGEKNCMNCVNKKVIHLK